MRILDLGQEPLTPALLVEVSAGPVAVRLGPEVRARLEASHAVVHTLAEGPAPIYGLNTGLGANLGHRLAPGEIEAFQVQFMAGRMVGTGPPLPEPVCRAAVLARLNGALRGAAGLSPAVIDTLCALLGQGLAPALPSIGSIGASDLALGAALGGALIGLGEIWRQGVCVPAAQALAEAGIAPVRLAPKDALALANHSAPSVALAAFVCVEARRLSWIGRGVAALSGEGYAMNAAIFDARIQALRPAEGQEEAAAWFRAGFAGGPLAQGTRARSIQDALSFRTMAPVFGSAAAALDRLEAALCVELGAGADNPAVLGTGEAAEMLSTPNFDTGALALALDGLALAEARRAGASAERILKLMTPQLSGLPRYLSPEGGAAAGYVPLQKTVAALMATIRHEAAPASLAAMAVSETVEDVAPQTLFAAQKLERQLDAVAWLTAIEGLVGAQAADLRAGAALGTAAGAVHAAIRAKAAPLGEDRPATPDIAATRAALEDGALIAHLAGLSRCNGTRPA
ncbi:MAG: aromatic amino acid lyase [Pseudomonadota bacterium]